MLSILSPAQRSTEKTHPGSTEKAGQPGNGAGAFFSPT